MLGFALSLVHGNCQTRPKNLFLFSLKLRPISADLISANFATIPRKSYHDLFHQVRSLLAGQVYSGSKGKHGNPIPRSFKPAATRRPER
jgi:hypothetical protein